jgi:O-antigen/teichoic acid export membrane protein
MILAVGVSVVILIIAKYQIASLFNEPNIIVIIKSMMGLTIISIPRYFSIYLMYRELKVFHIFISNLVYFGVMSFIIFYCVFIHRFLSFTDIINITYIGSFLSTIVSIILTFDFWKFKIKGKIKYTEIIKFSTKFAVTGITINFPRTLDVYAIQLFFGTNVVGLFAPAKTIFRFVEDLMNTIYALIYAPTVKRFADNDMFSLNQLISKIISLLVFVFGLVTVVCWFGGSNLFAMFLPENFIGAIPVFNVLMLSSIVMPITLLNTTISANGKPMLVAKFIIVGLLFWAGSFYVLGTYFNENVILAALPTLIFNIIFSILLFRYANRHYGLKIKQLFRIFTDLYYYISKKIN